MAADKNQQMSSAYWYAIREFLNKPRNSSKRRIKEQSECICVSIYASVYVSIWLMLICVVFIISYRMRMSYFE